MGPSAATLGYDFPCAGLSTETGFNSNLRPRASAYADSDTSGKYVSLRHGIDFAQHFATLISLEIADEVDCPAPNAMALRFAKIVLASFYSIEATPDQVTTTADGGVAICFVNGDKYADFECSNEGALLCVITTRRDRPVVWEVEHNAAAIDAACAKIKRFIAGDTR